MDMNDVQALQEKVRETNSIVYRLTLRADPNKEGRITGTIEVHFEDRTLIQWCSTLDGLVVRERGRCGKKHDGDVCNIVDGIPHFTHEGTTKRWPDTRNDP